MKDQLKELTGLMKDQKTSAAYNPNEHRNRQNHTRFCKWCRRSGHNISVCLKYRDHKCQNRKSPQFCEKFLHNYNRRSRCREEKATTIDIVTIISGITVADHIPHILDF